MSKAWGEQAQRSQVPELAAAYQQAGDAVTIAMRGCTRCRNGTLYANSQEKGELKEQALAKCVGPTIMATVKEHQAAIRELMKDYTPKEQQHKRGDGTICFLGGLMLQYGRHAARVNREEEHVSADQRRQLAGHLSTIEHGVSTVLNCNSCIYQPGEAPLVTAPGSPCGESEAIRQDLRSIPATLRIPGVL